jgi:hypothetical protein
MLLLQTTVPEYKIMPMLSSIINWGLISRKRSNKVVYKLIPVKRQSDTRRKRLRCASESILRYSNFRPLPPSVSTGDI